MRPRRGATWIVGLAALAVAAGACGSSSRGSAVGGAAGAAADGGDGGGDDDGGGLPSTPQRLLLRDEARSMVSYVEVGNPAAGWQIAVPYGRDLQLVGDGRFLIGTDNGYEERALDTGAVMAQQAGFPGTQSAHRLRDGNTILAGVNWQGGSGIVLVEVDAAGAVQRQIAFAGFTFVRLIRQTPAGTFLVTADDVVLEGDDTGQILWRADVPRVGATASHVWQALRIPTGETVVSTGYGASLQIFGADGQLTRTITGPADVIPNQFVGFQILPNGNFVVANWQGHSGETMGVQLLEYDPSGSLVWSYRPDPTTESLSLHHVIVLDGLDPNQLYVDDTTGVLLPVVRSKITMVTNGAATPTPGDAVMANRLRRRGFQVTFISDVAVTAADVVGQDLVLISSSAESGPLGIKLRDIGVPVVCAENGAFPTMGLTGTTLATDYGSTFNQTAVVIAADPPWTDVALTGSVTITSTPAELGWAVPAAGAVVRATMADNPAHAAWFAYPTGSQMASMVAPARRVGFAIRETVAANLTADGLTLFDAAVTFALGGDAPSSHQ
jgi:hypothetical protein